MQPGQGTVILEVFPTLTILGARDFEVVQTHSGCSVLGPAWFNPGLLLAGFVQLGSPFFHSKAKSSRSHATSPHCCSQHLRVG